MVRTHAEKVGIANRMLRSGKEGRDHSGAAFARETFLILRKKKTRIFREGERREGTRMGSAAFTIHLPPHGN